METTAVKKQSNRAIQRTHATYKKKSEISEALNLVRPHINESTHKFLSHFLYTNGTGVTQIKIAEWCKKVGISLGSYNKTVKPEIETTFGQSLIIKTPAPMKYDKKRKKKVKASEFKSLLPLSVLNHEIRLKKSKDAQEEEERFWNQIELPSEIESEIASEIASEIESHEKNAQIPCESKSESEQPLQQNNSFREKHVDKNIKIYKTSNKETDEISQNQSQKWFSLRKDVKALLSNPQINGLVSDEQKIAYGNKIQMFLKTFNLSLENSAVYETVLEVCSNCFYTYEKYPSKVHSDKYGAFYSSLKRGFIDLMLEQNGYDVQEMINNKEYDELNELREDGEHAFLELLKANKQLAATLEKQPKKEPLQAKKKPIRTELLPDWFDEKQRDEKDLKKAEEDKKRAEEKKKEIEVMLAELDKPTVASIREMQPRVINNLWG